MVAAGCGSGVMDCEKVVFGGMMEGGRKLLQLTEATANP
jgi:hypothetical protein